MIDWFNENSGFVSILIFVTTLVLGWVSGIFQALRKKPKFRINVITGPTMCSTFPTGNTHNGFDAHRTAISLYLKVTNVGSAPSTIDKIEIGYHWNISGLSFQSLKYRIGWYWLKKQTLSIEDFHTHITGDKFKVFPFLFQRSILTNSATDTYLEIGKNAMGIVYFEQNESWGASSPSVKNGHIKLKIKVYDSFLNSYSIISEIPMVDISDAKKYNKYFGETFKAISEKNESEI